MEFLEAAGFTHYWGYTPAVDFLRAYDQAGSQPEINVLLSGCSDIRHILKTLAARARKDEKSLPKINVPALPQGRRVDIH